MLGIGQTKGKNSLGFTLTDLVEMSASFRKEIEKYCEDNGFPIFFVEDIEFHQKEIRMRRSDGLRIIITADIKPTLVNDQSQIDLDWSFKVTHHKTSLNNSQTLT